MIAIMHRFLPPAWRDHLARHVATYVSADQSFQMVVKLKSGEGLVLAQSDLGVFPDEHHCTTKNLGTNTGKHGCKGECAVELGEFLRHFLLMKTGARITVTTDRRSLCFSSHFGF
ncbi:hypothetical protein EDC04DRAFT_458203 [Pisolithus marmoratus]|nr:hypothetical protein EDC04DRAFT_458203 [Pisolithus marmoratus]